MEWKRNVMVIEEFYKDPMIARDYAMKLDYPKEEYGRGVSYRSTGAYVERGVKGRLEQLMGAKIDCWEVGPHSRNCAFYLAFGEGEQAETPFVHVDDPLHWFTCVVYMTPKAALSSGTTLYRHKRTGMTQFPTKAVALKLGYDQQHLLDVIDRDDENLSKWEPHVVVGNRFNRAVVYQGRNFHAASQHFGKRLKEGRIFQFFHFSLKGVR